MSSRQRRDKSRSRSPRRRERLDVQSIALLVCQIGLGVLALTADPGTADATMAQAAIVTLALPVIVASALLMPRPEFTNARRPAAVASLALGVVSLVFLVEPSRRVYMGPGGILGAFIALLLIVQFWQARSRR